MKVSVLWTLIVFGLLVEGASAGIMFSFEFDGDTSLGSVPGTVSGTIFGLVDNASNQAATSILISSFPPGLGGTLNHVDALDFSSQIVNNFNVAGGQIVGGGFAAQDISGGATDTFIIGPVASLGGYNNVLSLDNGFTRAGNDDGSSGITYTASTVSRTLFPRFVRHGCLYHGSRCRTTPPT